jgi:hypothetical protein
MKAFVFRTIPLSLLIILACLISAVPALPAARPEGAGSAIQAERIPTDLTRKQPLLIWPGDVTQMKVVWQLTSTAPSTIDWGVDTTYAVGSQITAEYGADHQHTYTITGLAPAQKYYYRVTTAGSPVYKGNFNSAPSPNATDLKFFVYGDTRTNTSEHNLVAGAMVSGYTAEPAYQSLVLSVGDLVATGGTESVWDSEFFNATYTNIRALTAHLPYHSCMGNHEGTGILFAKYFPYPFQGGRYWSFDYGPIHVTVIDQYTSYAPGSAQYTWITSDLAASTKPWKFILLHEPGWSAGGGHENNVSVQNYIQPLCVQYHVPVVLGGHNHYYARAEVNGIEHITTGGGGAPLYTPNSSYPYIVRAAQAYHYCKIEISGGVLTFTALTPTGTILDTFTLQRPASVEPPTPEASLGTARPNPFSSSTVIDWNLPAGLQADLVILDVCGRQIRRFPLAQIGSHSTRWDGTNATGQPVGSGSYYYRIEPEQDHQMGKLLLLR